MKTIPAVGQRVIYRCTLNYPGATERSVTGVVTKNDWLPLRECLNDDELDSDPEAEPVWGKVRPDEDQKVTVRVDYQPGWWPYRGSDLFCPDVKDLEPIEEIQGGSKNVES